MSSAEPAQGHEATASDRYTVATDGACKGNPGPAGWAWVGEDGQWAAGSVVAGTNNVGELAALLHALQDNASVRNLTVLADSMYAIQTYESWMEGHRRRGWLTSAKKPVKNQELLEALIAAKEARRSAGLPAAVLQHVKGHSGHLLNSWADERAVRASGHAAAGRELVWQSRRGLDPIDVSARPPASGEDRPSRQRPRPAMKASR
ncbi:ribonuclease HI [Microbacterium resistens]|uniref:ribonuclease H n=1 Tax=Microbacterium resistens TaxID=156977 RepID=A0ABU1SG63_9MICO|nr:ribonuclease H [Microbacterium resistens]MDR6868581.1 ribonuclease HI [Microbacterium resistens]